MRDFINAIFAVIGATSITDLEFAAMTVDVPTYSVELYEELLGVIDSREDVSNMRDRLRFAFLSRGIEVPESSNGKSNIYIGDVL